MKGEVVIEVVRTRGGIGAVNYPTLTPMDFTKQLGHIVIEEKGTDWHYFWNDPSVGRKDAISIHKGLLSGFYRWTTVDLTIVSNPLSQRKPAMSKKKGKHE